MRKKFLVEYQHDFWKKISKDMRKHGWKIPLTHQNNGFSPVLSYMRFDYDYTDMHFYIGHPIIIKSSNNLDCHIWRVQYGFSTVYFGEYADAMDFCREHFCDLAGNKLKKAKEKK